MCLQTSSILRDEMGHQNWILTFQSYLLNKMFIMYFTICKIAKWSPDLNQLLRVEFQCIG